MLPNSCEGVPNPLRCVLCNKSAVSHRRCGVTQPARYLRLTTAQGWTSYNQYAVCGWCLCNQWVHAKHSVDLDDPPRTRRERREEFNKFDRLLGEAVGILLNKKDLLPDISECVLTTYIVDEVNTGCEGWPGETWPQDDDYYMDLDDDDDRDL